MLVEKKSQRGLKIIDLGWGQIMRELQKTKNSYTKVGFPENGNLASNAEADRESFEELIKVAAANEFGTARIPERSFIRKSYDDNRAMLQRIVNDEWMKIVRGKSTTKKSLERIGEWMTGKTRKTITEVQTPPNAPSTIANKAAKIRNTGKKESFLAGTGNPLIDSGQMRQSVQNIEVINE